MSLFRESQEGETAYGMTVVKASRGDRLRADGWEECGTCEGTGNRNRVAEAKYGGPWACPDCVDGLISPEGMVEAAAEAIFLADYERTAHAWELLHPSYKEPFLRRARAALEATARWGADASASLEGDG